MSRLTDAFDERRRRLDRWQQRHRPVAFVVAVARKASDDALSDRAAVVAFYGFFALFPLLLLLVTTLGFLLEGDVDLQERVLREFLEQFPDQEDQIADAIGSLRGSGIALALGLVGALLTGTRVLQAMQLAMDDIWGVPIRSRANAAIRIARSVGMLVLLLLAAFVAVGLSWAVTFIDGYGTVTTLASAALSVVALGAVFLLFFQVMTQSHVAWRDLWPGAVVAAVGWVAIERLSSFLLERGFRSVSPTSVFVVALALLLWMTVQARLVLLAAEINAVRTLALWPRSLRGDPLTPGDRRAYAHYAATEERVEGEEIDVAFTPRRARSTHWQRRRRLRAAPSSTRRERR